MAFSRVPVDGKWENNPFILWRPVWSSVTSEGNKYLVLADNLHHLSFQEVDKRLPQLAQGECIIPTCAAGVELNLFPVCCSYCPGPGSISSTSHESEWTPCLQPAYITQLFPHSTKFDPEGGGSIFTLNVGIFHKSIQCHTPEDHNLSNHYH